MIRKLIHKIKMVLHPPKCGEVYSGDCFDFVVGKPVEKFLHGMTDKYGNFLWEYVPGRDSYRFTVISVQPAYYICEAELLVSFCHDINKKKWLKRSRMRRIPKIMFHDFILTERLEKNVALNRRGEVPGTGKQGKATGDPKRSSRT